MAFGEMSLSQRIKRCRQFSAPYRNTDGSKFKLKDVDPGDTDGLEAEDKPRAKEFLVLGVETLAELQQRLYAQDQWAVLALFQAMDAAGKDGTIKHVMSGVNPQGCQVYAFKQPTSEDLDHDYLWRCLHRMPERGRIGIFNRSYYEEVLVVKVHGDFLASQKIPPSLVGKTIWEDRYASFAARLLSQRIETGCVAAASRQRCASNAPLAKGQRRWISRKFRWARTPPTTSTSSSRSRWAATR